MRAASSFESRERTPAHPDLSLSLPPAHTQDTRRFHTHAHTHTHTSARTKVKRGEIDISVFFVLPNSDFSFLQKHDLVVVRVCGCWDMKSTELHAVLYRRLQREINDLLVTKLERPSEDTNERCQLLRTVIEALLKPAREES